mmetsp:Transcript_74080/g.204438  ORF Transcript_74080/g.204438 Transcript_74080/m.204438 type:complete len:207 (-) Transcript_74080:213-833(-)
MGTLWVATASAASQLPSGEMRCTTRMPSGTASQALAMTTFTGSTVMSAGGNVLAAFAPRVSRPPARAIAHSVLSWLARSQSTNLTRLGATGRSSRLGAGSTTNGPTAGSAAIFGISSTTTPHAMSGSRHSRICSTPNIRTSPLTRTFLSRLATSTSGSTTAEGPPTSALSRTLLWRRRPGCRRPTRGSLGPIGRRRACATACATGC